MMKLLVIADDYTGALDTGAQFAKIGIPTRVICGKTFDVSDARGDGVVCLDAETRHLTSDEAYQTVYGIVASACEAGVEMVFKKVDSTLRGQIAAELSAMFDAGGESVVFAPAYPSLGRTTVGGVHMLNGTPIHESVFGRDPFEPTKHSDIAKLLRDGREVKVVNIPLGAQADCSAESRIEVYDAVTDDDLNAVVAQAVARGAKLFAGCAGLAQALAGQMTAIPRVIGAPAVKDGILVVCGSLNPISDAQIEAARAGGFACVEIPADFLGKDALDQSQCEAIAERLCRAGESGSKVLLTTPKRDVRENSVTAEARERTAKRIGEVVKAWYRKGRDDTLVVTGGDTLYAFLHVIGSRVSLKSICELQPGVICSVLRDDDGSREMQIVSKAGGFGTENVYVDIARLVLAQAQNGQEARIS